MRAVMNLLGNAIKFTPIGGNVSVSVTNEKDKVVISVSDEGPGIPANMLQRVFERSCHTESPEGGLGLGLYIALKVIKAHGGDIWIERSTSKGSIFSFSLLKQLPN